VRARVAAATVEGPNQPGSKSAAAGDNCYKGCGADTFSASSAARRNRLIERTQAAVRITESHSLAVIVRLLRSAFGGVDLANAFAGFLHHDAAAKDLEAHITVVVKIKLDGRVWLQLDSAERAQINCRANRRRRFNSRAGKQARPARGTRIIHRDRLITGSGNPRNELLWTTTDLKPAPQNSIG